MNKHMNDSLLVFRNTIIARSSIVFRHSERIRNERGGSPNIAVISAKIQRRTRRMGQQNEPRLRPKQEASRSGLSVPQVSSFNPPF